MTYASCLGLPLPQALQMLAEAGVAPVRVVEIHAPKREPGVGRLRVIRVQEDGHLLTVCAFIDTIREENHASMDAEEPTGRGDTGRD